MMEELVWIAFEHLTNLCQGLYCSVFVFLMLTYKNKHVKKALSVSLATALLYLSLTIVNSQVSFEGMGIFIYSLVLLVFAMANFDGSILKKIIISIIPVNALAVGSVVSTNFVSSLANIPILNLMTESSKYRFITVIISNVVSVLILAIVAAVSKKQSFELGNSEWIFMGTVLFISVLTFNFIYNIAFETTSRTSRMYIAFAMIGLVTLDVLSYILMMFLSKKHSLSLENDRLKQQYYFQEESTKEIKRQYEQLHKVRHDFNNILEVIRVLNNSGQNSQINEYIQKYQSSQNDIIHIINTDNDYLNAIINSKLSLANNAGIDVSINVTKDIGDKYAIELCSIISNMFDNAVEACGNCITQKKIIFEVFQQGNVLELIMKNSIDVSVLANNPRLLTIKKSKENHGYGTKIISETAINCHGFADFYEDNNMFCCHVVVNKE